MTISNVISSTPVHSDSATRATKNDKRPAATPQPSTVVSISHEARKLDSDKHSVNTTAAPKPAAQTESAAPKQAVTHDQPHKPDEARNPDRPATASNPTPQTKAPAPKQTVASEPPPKPVEPNNSASTAPQPTPQPKASAPKPATAPEFVNRPEEARHSERAAAASNLTAQAKPAQSSQVPEAPGIKFMTGESKRGHVNTYA